MLISTASVMSVADQSHHPNERSGSLATWIQRDGRHRSRLGLRTLAVASLPLAHLPCVLRRGGVQILQSDIACGPHTV